MLAESVIDLWRGTPLGYVMPIHELDGSGCRGWGLRTEATCGVAIPFENESFPIRESFSNVDLYADALYVGPEECIECLILMSSAPLDSMPFATLCSEFVSPGRDGEQRRELVSNPRAWWKEWKELLGNKNVDERVYDTLGELTVLAYLAEQGENALWNGPNGATYDIDCSTGFIEVKSTTARKKREVTLSNRFQLVPPNGEPLRLVLCQFEPSQSGYCIDSVVDVLADLGYSRSALNANLEKVGLGVGKSARRRYYVLHDMTEYEVDDSFPAIRDSSFVDGAMPACVTGFSYTLSLDGIQGKSLLKEEETPDAV